MFVPRALSPTLRHATSHFPVAVLTGPRQAGKSTLLRHEAPDHAYVTFDDPLERDLARADPRGFLARFDGSVILDEIQYAPEILSLVKLAVDRERRPGRFLITGSQQFSVMDGVRESLAGRAAVLHLLPFSLIERPPASLAEAVWLGGYPEPALNPAIRDLWARSYLTTYVERDVRQVSGVAQLRTFEALLGLCAARHGQEVNFARLGREAGISGPTVKNWLGAMQRSFVLLLLEPWHRNYGKRIVRAPKLYFLDPALVCVLTRHPAAETALAGPMGGCLFEGLVVAEVAKAFFERGETPSMGFWRANDGLEVDLIVQAAGGLIPVEAKRTASPASDHAAGLRRITALAGNEVAHPGVVVCDVAEERPLGQGVVAMPWRAFASWIRERLGGVH